MTKKTIFFIFYFISFSKILCFTTHKKTYLQPQNTRNASFKIKCAYSIQSLAKLIVITTTLKIIYNLLYPKQEACVVKGHNKDDYFFGPLNEHAQKKFSTMGKSRFSRELNEASMNIFATKKNYKIKMKKFNRTDFHKNLVKQFNMYQFQGFREYIKDLKEYEEHILKTNQRLRYNQDLHKKLDNIQGFKKGELITYIKQEAKRIYYKQKELELEQEYNIDVTYRKKMIQKRTFKNSIKDEAAKNMEKYEDINLENL